MTDGQGAGRDGGEAVIAVRAGEGQPAGARLGETHTGSGNGRVDEQILTRASAISRGTSTARFSARRRATRSGVVPPTTGSSMLKNSMAPEMPERRSRGSDGQP